MELFMGGFKQMLWKMLTFCKLQNNTLNGNKNRYNRYTDNHFNFFFNISKLFTTAELHIEYFLQGKTLTAAQQSAEIKRICMIISCYIRIKLRDNLWKQGVSRLDNIRRL